MSPDARAICAAILSQTADGFDPATGREKTIILEAALPKDAPGIRGMVPVAYLKDVIDGFIARLEAVEPGAVLPLSIGEPYIEALNYAKRRLADVEGL